AAHAPAEHAQAVDHGGVRVGADDGIGIGVAVVVEHYAGQVLDVHLVHDAGVRRHDLEVVEGLLAPAQELVALAVALELDLVVPAQRVHGTVEVDLHRVVDDQFGRGQRVDLLRVTAKAGDGIAHGGK